MLSIGIVAALHSYTLPTSDVLVLGFWVTCGVKIENDVIKSLLRPTATSNLLSASILDIYRVYEHIDMMFIGI